MLSFTSGTGSRERPRCRPRSELGRVIPGNDSLPRRLQSKGADEFLDSVEAFFDVGHAGGVADADVIVGAEGDAWDGGDFLLFEEAGAEIGGFEAGLRDIREEVEGSLGVHARDAGDGIELLVGEAAAFRVFGEPGGEMILRSVEGGDGPFLGKGGWVAGAVALDGVDGFGDRFGCGEVAKAPTGHGVGLCEAVHDNGVVVMSLGEAGDAGVGGTIVNEFLVNFVAHDEHAFFDADVAEGFDFVARVKRAGGVAGRIEDEQAGARGDCFAELVGGDFELGFVAGFEDDWRGGGELDHFRVAQPVGSWDDDFVAFFAGSEDHVVAGVFAAAGDDDLARLIGEAIVALEFVSDGLAEFGNAAAGGVLGEAVIDGFDGGVLDVLGGIEIGFARAEANDVLTLGFHLLGLGVDGQGERWSQGGGAARDFIVHKTAERNNGEGGGAQVACFRT